MRITARKLPLLLALLVSATTSIADETRLAPAVTSRLFGNAATIDGNSAVVLSIANAHLFDLETGDKRRFNHAFEPGYPLSASIHGNRLVVGGSVRESSTALRGFAYLYDVTTGQRLAAFSPHNPNDFHSGGAVSTDGRHILIGSPGSDLAGENVGAAFLYDAETFDLMFQMTPSDPDVWNKFGTSVAVDGNYAVIGAQGSSQSLNTRTTTYVFDTSIGEERFQFELDGTVSSIDVSGDFAVIGSQGFLSPESPDETPGRAYLVDLKNGELVTEYYPPSDSNQFTFGKSVSMSGELVAVGSPLANDVGAAYLFDLTSGEHLARFVSPDDMPFDFFGEAVALEGTKLVVGAHLSDFSSDKSGTAFVFDVSNVPEPNFSLTWCVVIFCANHFRRLGKPRRS